MGATINAKPSYFTSAEWRQIAIEYELWNSDGRDEPVPLGDFALMSWLATLIEEGQL